MMKNKKLKYAASCAWDLARAYEYYLKGIEKEPSEEGERYKGRTIVLVLAWSSQARVRFKKDDPTSFKLPDETEISVKSPSSTVKTDGWVFLGEIS